jgi:hypothetical protein
MPGEPALEQLVGDVRPLLHSQLRRLNSLVANSQRVLLHTEGGLCQAGCHCDVRGDGDRASDLVVEEPELALKLPRFDSGQNGVSRVGKAEENQKYLGALIATAATQEHHDSPRCQE